MPLKTDNSSSFSFILKFWMVETHPICIMSMYIFALYNWTAENSSHLWTFLHDDDGDDDKVNRWVFSLRFSLFSDCCNAKCFLGYFGILVTALPWLLPEASFSLYFVLNSEFIFSVWVLHCFILSRRSFPLIHRP